MDLATAIKVIKRRVNHLNKRIESAGGSESALIFDKREKEALEFLLNEVSPPAMAKEIDSDGSLILDTGE